MSCRTLKERILQTLAFEAGGLCLSVPLVMALHGRGAGDSGALMLGLTLAVLAWSMIHNAVFDWCDLRWTGRVASDRPRALRLCHAVSHEVTAVAVTLPIMVWCGGLAPGQAFETNVALTLFYTVWAYVFHLGYDRLRPVAPAALPA